MSYVLANTASNLGRRGLGRMGWDNPPYTFYPLPKTVRNLNGLGDQNPNGAITYRIDPQSGKYNFYRTDLKPRGVFMQNTFQHPAPPVVSALRRPIRGITSREPIMALSGLGCGSCGGTCNTLDGPRFVRRRRRTMGDDTFTDPNTGGVMDSDGNLLTLPCGPGGAQVPTSQCPKNTSVLPGASDPGLVQQIVSTTPQQNQSAISQAVQAISSFGPQQPNIVAQQPPSWFNGITMVGGTPVSNTTLAAGAALLAVALGSMGGGKRR